MTEEEIENTFPNLGRGDYKITSETDFNYNCIAWAAGDTKNWWQPSGAKYNVWLTFDRSESLGNYIENFKVLGYKEETESSEYELGFEKIALYIDADGLPSHAARQKDNGFWTSKLGWSEDIEHKTLEGLEGEGYGKVKTILKRPNNTKNEMDMPENVAENKFEDFKNIVKNIVNVPKKEIDEQLKLERENKQKNKKRK